MWIFLCIALIFEKWPNSFVSGDDGTRTRDLLRDRQAF